MNPSLSVSEKNALRRAVTNPSLLPLFFQNISGLKWFDYLNSEGLFAPEKNPCPVHNEEEGLYRVQPWTAIDYLASSSILLKEEANNDYAQQYLQIIRDATKYAKENDFGNYRTWWQFSEVLQNLPPDILTLEDIDLIEYWLGDKFESGLLIRNLTTWVSMLIDSPSDHIHALIIALIKKIYQLESRAKSYGVELEVEFKFKSYAMQDFIEKTSFELGKKIGHDAVSVIESCLEEVSAIENNDRYSTIWRPAIDDHPQNTSVESTSQMILVAYRDALLGYALTNSIEFNKYLQVIFDGRSIIKKRVALLGINENYNIVDEQLHSTILTVDFFNYKFQHEMWHLLANHFGSFTSENRKATLNVINQIKYDNEEGIGNRASATAYGKLIWLTAIKDLDEEALQLYEDNLSVTGTEPEHPDFSSYHTVMAGFIEKSDISAQEMQKMTPIELVTNLNSYEAPNEHFDSPSLRGLTKEFNLYVKNNLPYVINQLENLTDLNGIFVYELIESFHHNLNDEEFSSLNWDQNWVTLIGFFEQLISQTKLLELERYKEEGDFIANRGWLIGSIGMLITSGCQSERHSFDLSLVDQIKEILFVLLDTQQGSKFSAEDDAISIAINSPRGKCLVALINLALFACRACERDTPEHLAVWEKFEYFFTQEFKKVDSEVFEFATLGSNYLQNFKYLSKEWVEKNLPSLFYKENKEAQRYAMQGYAFTNRFDPVVYNYLSQEGMLLKALDDVIQDKVRGRFIQFIVISYINGNESLNTEGCLVNSLIERQQPEELWQLIWFVWTLRNPKSGSIDEKLLGKIFELWSQIISQIDCSTLKGKKIASKLCHWADFITDLQGDQYVWLKQIAPFAPLEYNAPRLLTALARLSDKRPLEAGNVLYAMLSDRASDAYPEEDITLILKNLVENGDEGTKIAHSIVSQYLKYNCYAPMNIFRNINKSA